MAKKGLLVFKKQISCKTCDFLKPSCVHLSKKSIPLMILLQSSSRIHAVIKETVFRPIFPSFSPLENPSKEPLHFTHSSLFYPLFSSKSPFKTIWIHLLGFKTLLYSTGTLKKPKKTHLDLFSAHFKPSGLKILLCKPQPLLDGLKPFSN